jgi:hypothetical protein
MTTISETNPATHRVKNHFVRNVIIKGLILFLLINTLFGIFDPLPVIGKLSAYNYLFPGRVRLPYGDNPERAYNLSLFNLDAMFASHELSRGRKPSDEYRVILIGDSSTWGFLLKPGDTLSANLNDADHSLPDGRRVKVYNLGYPVMSLMKDLLILSRAMEYKPDLIIWPLTLESFPYDKQLFPPLLKHNAGPVRALIQKYNLTINPSDPNFIQDSFWNRTIIGNRRELADLLRLQLYGVMWAATGIDQDIPDKYTPRQEDLSADQSFHNLQPPHLRTNDLAFELLHAGVQAAGKTPVVVINEPMFISQGKNSTIRYNFYYPRWAYDDYRRLLSEESKKNGWNYLDMWNAIPPADFTNTAVHLSPEGSRLFAGMVGKIILEYASPKP